MTVWERQAFVRASRIPERLAEIARPRQHSFSAPRSMVCFLTGMPAGTWTLSHTALMERMAPDAASNVSPATGMLLYISIQGVNGSGIISFPFRSFTPPIHTFLLRRLTNEDPMAFSHLFVRISKIACPSIIIF